ncbi:hypothetical protein V6N11_019388 [Hibiscus sabdariffa]|uniref:Uncharacterized protein n=1 Tax=Hibiscus sabdariffa TaxID=183260 RepID=A0ABR2R2C8_9ROSI
MSLTLQKNNSFKGFYTAINQADDFIGRLFFLSWELYHDVCLVEEEALEAILFGKDHNNDEGMLGKEGGRRVEDADILGCSPIKVSADNDKILKENSIVKKGQDVILGTAGVDGKPSWVEVVSKQLEENNDSLIKEIDGKEPVSPTVEIDFASSKLSGNNQILGLQSPSSESQSSPIKSKSSWAASVDERMNASYNKNGETDSSILKQCGAQSEEEEPMSFFPELSWEVSIREARKALELGKSVGLQILGDEEEVVKEMALLDAN